MKSSEAMILAGYERNFSNCVEKPENFRTSAGLTCMGFKLLHLISYPQFNI